MLKSVLIANHTQIALSLAERGLGGEGRSTAAVIQGSALELPSSALVSSPLIPRPLLPQGEGLGEVKLYT